jgi:hypothetical protein
MDSPHFAQSAAACFEIRLGKDRHPHICTHAITHREREERIHLPKKKRMLKEGKKSVPGIGVGQDKVGVTELGGARDGDLIFPLLLCLLAASAHRDELLQPQHLRRPGRRSSPRGFGKTVGNQGTILSLSLSLSIFFSSNGKSDNVKLCSRIRAVGENKRDIIAV